MKHTIRTDKVLDAYRILSTAKYSKLSDEDKIRVWKIARALKPVADRFDEDTQDAAKKMKPTEDFDERWQKAQEYERMLKANEDMANAPIGAAQYGEFVKEFGRYKKLVDDAVREFADKDTDIEYDTISEDAFGKLMASNEWTMDQVMAVSEIVT